MSIARDKKAGAGLNIKKYSYAKQNANDPSSFLDFFREQIDCAQRVCQYISQSVSSVFIIYPPFGGLFLQRKCDIIITYR